MFIPSENEKTETTDGGSWTRVKVGCVISVCVLGQNGMCRTSNCVLERRLFSITHEKYSLLSCIRTTWIQSNIRTCLFYRACFQVFSCQNPAETSVRRSSVIQEVSSSDVKSTVAVIRQHYCEQQPRFPLQSRPSERSCGGNAAYNQRSLWDSGFLTFLQLWGFSYRPWRVLRLPYAIISPAPRLTLLWSGFNLLIWDNLGIFFHSH